MNAIETFISHIQDLPKEKQKELLSDMFNYSGEVWQFRNEQYPKAMEQIQREIQTLKAA